ncbi:phage tail domain-containing protein [Cohnella lupini]|uniref:Tail protein n=1 Tax=Cohnella lupini TaxID=1294267 RepID=A0A3D9HZG4_9BACL|nr:phage tail domain-containing protein [Cohnella lupini]RED54800.1 tail protein [Cohnella lupini]
MLSTIRLDGIDNLDLNFHVLRGSAYPVLPNTVERVLSIPGKNGAWHFGSDLDVKQFDFICAINAQNAEQLQQYVSSLASFLVDIYGKPRELKLVLLSQPDREYIARYSGSSPLDRNVGYGEFTLPLIAFDPFGYSQENIYETTITTTTFQTVISSDGNVRTEPIIELKNNGSTTLASFTIQNEYQAD